MNFGVGSLWGVVGVRGDGPHPTLGIHAGDPEIQMQVQGYDILSFL